MALTSLHDSLVAHVESGAVPLARDAVMVMPAHVERGEQMQHRHVVLAEAQMLEAAPQQFRFDEQV